MNGYVLREEPGTAPDREELDGLDCSIKRVDRGWSYPESIIALYENKELNASEILLLGRINASCGRQDGCYMTNRTLAEWWHKTTKHVSRSISLFERLCLISITYDHSIKGIRQNRKIRHIWVEYQGDRITTKDPGTKMSTTPEPKCPT